MTLRAFFCAALAAILCPGLLPTPSYAADWDLDQLMQTLAQTRSGHVRFVETKTIAMLDKPVESSGELFYKAPDHLEKRTLKPKPETMVLDQGTLQVERGRQKHSLRMQDYPELAAFIDSIRGTLAGDRQALERNFRLSLDGKRESWNLRLVPANDKMLAVGQTHRHRRYAGTRSAHRDQPSRRRQFADADRADC